MFYLLLEIFKHLLSDFVKIIIWTARGFHGPKIYKLILSYLAMILLFGSLFTWFLRI